MHFCKKNWAGSELLFNLNKQTYYGCVCAKGWGIDSVELLPKRLFWKNHWREFEGKFESEFKLGLSARALVDFNF